MAIVPVSRAGSVARGEPAAPDDASPLSVLPAGVLCRSLFTNTVSSTPWLLTPAISFLSYLCQPRRPLLFDVQRNGPLAWLMKQTVYKQFCAGETPAETKSTMRHMRAMGFRGTIITLATETVFDYRKNLVHGLGVDAGAGVGAGACPAIASWRKRTLEAVELLDEGDQLAIKITGAGPLVTDALAAGEPLPQQMLDALDEISTRCKAQQARILIDAESQLYQFGILQVGVDLMRKYNRDGHAVIYNTYQAYLKSTPASVAGHLAAALEGNFTMGLKLVRGAYLATDQRSLIHDTKADTDAAYDAIALGALRQDLLGFGGGRPAAFPSLNLILASHNRESVLAAHELHRRRSEQGLPTVPVGFAQLQGMSDALSFGLLRLGGAPEVYKCSTWGSLAECLGYLARRAAENRDAASRTHDEFAALKAEARRRLGRLLGNLGTAIINKLVGSGDGADTGLPFTKIIACVRSERSQAALEKRFPGPGALTVSRGDNAGAVRDSDVVILAVDPTEVEEVLAQAGVRDALAGKFLITVAAGWSTERLETALYGGGDAAAAAADTQAPQQRAYVLRALPNIAALVGHGLTAIEVPPSNPPPPEHLVALAESVFRCVGQTVRLPPRLMDAATAVGGSTPAFFSIVCDALIDASVAVGLPRQTARAMITQAMRGSAALLQEGGLQTGELRDQGTSPGGCTIGGVMVLEEGGVRGHVGRALREAVTVASLMGKVENVNYTR
ncbi:proline oxidase [Purpureocillium lavendulum]|uniref:Proline dehydrogenase n=1 Tax=Purpureocillium lavendulum TaxID=1247861 RepID=A0AB34FPI3_9HYPO|nr:proline oxidase [Purpureocillium lavendulum]